MIFLGFLGSLRRFTFVRFDIVVAKYSYKKERREKEFVQNGFNG
jgi:hypothetical protein